ncbi:metalloprotease [Cladochytrium replicatum]|nr:metalloprotease [Cladochytrium replicatum]
MKTITFNLLASAFLLTVANGAPVELSMDKGGCGTSRSPAETAAREAQFRDTISSSHLLAVQDNSTIDIPVAFHVVYNGPNYADGNISGVDVAAQIDALNKHYSNTPFQFYLANLTRTFNDRFFKFATKGNVNQDYMKAALRQGNEATLNIYTVAFTKSLSLNGYSTFPDAFAEKPVDDGVVLIYKVLPNGTRSNHNMGAIATHEIGHWFGLYHTFEGGCDGDGDYVADTPPEAEPAWGCVVGRDTCTNDTFPDPIHNFMDYSDDSCLTDPFTPGQVERMSQQWAAFRAKSWYPKGSQPAPETIPAVDP